MNERDTSVLLVGKGDIAEIELLPEAVSDRGAEPIVCDVTQWPGDAPLTYDPADDGATLGTRFEFEDVTGAYVVTTRLFQPGNLRFHESLSEDPRPTVNRLREIRAMVESACRTLDGRGVEMIPPPEDYDWHGRKPWQLKLLDEADVPIPDTLFTNSPDELRRFYEDHEKVVYKPVTRGGGPKVLTEADLTDSRLDDLAGAPVQFQAFAPGDDLRVYFLDGEVVGCMRYSSDSFSFKVDMEDGKEIAVESFDPPTAVESAVERAARASGLPFGAADVRLAPNGEFEVLELNDTPRFAAADLQCGMDVAGELADYLVGE